MTQKRKAIVLVSGGMDSVTALYDATERFQVLAGLSFDYGSKHNHRELPFAAWHCRRLELVHQVVVLDFMDRLFESNLLRSGGDIPEGHYEEQNMKQTVVPFRNGIMLAIAAGYAESIGAEALLIAAHSGDHAIYPDCRETFMSAMAQAMRAGTYAEVELVRPFITMTKAQIVIRGAELRVDFAKTWSCYKGQDQHCGLCGTCTERREAFRRAGVPDPTDYIDTPALPS